MSIARAWRGEKDPRSESKRGPASAADRISAIVIESTLDHGPGLSIAMKKLAQGMRRRVTFRRDANVSMWVKSKRRRQTFEQLPEMTVYAGVRGTAVAVMVDGRDLVKLNDGCEVLARLGKDCRLLGRWYRLVDWLRGRTFA